MCRCGEKNSISKALFSVYNCKLFCEYVYENIIKTGIYVYMRLYIYIHMYIFYANIDVLKYNYF